MCTVLWAQSFCHHTTTILQFLQNITNFWDHFYSTRADEPWPCLLERLPVRIWPFHTVTVRRKSPRGFWQSDVMPAGTPKRRLSECNLDNRLFRGAKSSIARKDRGSAGVDYDFDDLTTLTRLQLVLELVIYISPFLSRNFTLPLCDFSSFLHCKSLTCHIVAKFLDRSKVVKS